ncbi:GNAT family N-acetyltransferase [Nocardioides sp. cx-173]|uniref:GNAT family N-acetyltransferase n=1 Tax=Nocardioides sp. cx-173 TaxID=2898796 RepID=UPI001E566515|nr:GNAT family N-acetyltransferase [Nocardioides sp. cx-173]MCD4526159.1 GNAT family N-acetyltransferase [Nocardioides sp. cx-173]UGB40626.1 GNAT family N-acetyltransferase [Nocardioides sp. cx-173]
MRLRRATPEDHEAVGRATVAAYAPFLHDGGPTSDYALRLADTATRDREAEVWVAEEDGEILGSVTICLPGTPWAQRAEEGEGEFRMLAVDPSARGRGVGRALLDLVVERLRADGARAVVLGSLGDMTDAHRLYERAGFTRVPERDWSPQPGVHLRCYRLPMTREEP